MQCHELQLHRVNTWRGAETPPKFRLKFRLKKEARSIHAGRPGKTRICRRSPVEEGATSRQAPQWTHPPAVVRVRDPPIVPPEITRLPSAGRSMPAWPGLRGKGKGGRSRLLANRRRSHAIPGDRNDFPPPVPPVPPNQSLAGTVQTTPHVLHTLIFSPHDQGTQLDRDPYAMDKTTQTAQAPRSPQPLRKPCRLWQTPHACPWVCSRSPLHDPQAAASHGSCIRWWGAMEVLGLIHTPCCCECDHWKLSLFDLTRKSPRTFDATRNMMAHSHTGQLNLAPHT